MSMDLMRGRLSRKFTAGFLLLAVLVSTATCSVGFVEYKATIERMYHEAAEAAARTARSYVEGDRVPEWLESGRTDSAYLEMAQRFDRLLADTGMHYLFVYVPDGDEIRYVYDAVNSSAPQNRLGETDPISRKYKALVLDIFRTGIPSESYFISQSAYGYNTSGILPVFNSKGDVAALVNADLTMTLITSSLRKYLLAALGFGSLLVFLFVFVYLNYLKRRVVSPIRQITENAASFVKQGGGFFAQTLSIHTGDEIETLAQALARMEQDISDYIRDLACVTAEKERIAAELGVAATIQESMLPSIFPPFPTKKEAELYASMRPARQVGGDFYDFFLTGERTLCFLIADVSGKGVPAALFMVIAKTLLKNEAQLGLPPEEVLQRVNRQLCETNDAQMFVTVLLFLLNLDTGELTFSNAGHNPPVLVGRDGTCVLLSLSPGLPLACMEEVQYQRQSLGLRSGDQLFLYTDGVTEAANPAQKLFGEGRLLEALSGVQGSLDQLQQALWTAISAFADGAEQADDVTMLNLRFHAPLGPGLMFEARSACLPALLDELDRCIFGSAFLQIRGDLRVVAEEVFVNIASYAYPEGQGAAVQFSCAVDSGDPPCLILEFRDSGIPFNPLNLPEPDLNAPLEARSEGGLGIFLVQQLMDRAAYRFEDGQNVLTLYKTAPVPH